MSPFMLHILLGSKIQYLPPQEDDIKHRNTNSLKKQKPIQQHPIREQMQTVPSCAQNYLKAVERMLRSYLQKA